MSRSNGLVILLVSLYWRVGLTHEHYTMSTQGKAHSHDWAREQLGHQTWMRIVSRCLRSRSEVHKGLSRSDLRTRYRFWLSTVVIWHCLKLISTTIWRPGWRWNSTGRSATRSIRARSRGLTCNMENTLCPQARSACPRHGSNGETMISMPRQTARMMTSIDLITAS